MSQAFSRIFANFPSILEHFPEFPRILEHFRAFFRISADFRVFHAYKNKNNKKIEMGIKMEKVKIKIRIKTKILKCLIISNALFSQPLKILTPRGGSPEHQTPHCQPNSKPPCQPNSRTLSPPLQILRIKQQGGGLEGERIFYLCFTIQTFSLVLRFQ